MKTITVNQTTGEIIPPELAEQEAVIERGLQTFVEVGQALQRIRDERLYREQFDRFEDYCRERWGWDKSYCTRIIAAADVTVRMVPIGTAPATESQARPLTKLPADEQADAWEEVLGDCEAEGVKPTAKRVQQVVAKRVKKKIKPDPSVLLAEAELLQSETLTLILDLHDPRASAGFIVKNCEPEYVRELVGFLNSHLLKGTHNG